MITRFDIDEPLVTVVGAVGAEDPGAYFSLSPMGPLWSSSEPSSPTEIDRSERSRFSPKYS